MVKSLALSKLTHVVQVIPNPATGKIKQLQKIINSFIWTGSHCKKTVVRGEISEQPMEQGGLAVPNVEKFWNSLKVVWVNRLFQASDDSKWRCICLQQTGRAIGTSNLTSTKLLQIGASSLADACNRRLTNVFWKNVWSVLPSVERTYYSKNKYIQSEMNVWGSESIQFRGKPLDKRDFTITTTQKFSKVADLLNPETGLPWKETDHFITTLSRRELSDWHTVMEATTTFLTENHMTWYHISTQVIQPQHLGWSRLMCNGSKSRFFYNLMQFCDTPGTRNSNERAWENMGLRNMTEARWDSVYRNFATLRTNYRVKFQEFRVIWARQELQKYRLYYGRPGEENDPSCSYCSGDIENELHLYVNCEVMECYWKRAAQWFKETFDVSPPIGLKVPRLFGLEKEKPNDLLNIFFRSVRYCIYRNRKYATGPSIEALEELLVDELDRKYGKEKWKKYEEHPSEFMAISWLRMKKGWNHIKPTWLPQI